MSQTLRDRLAAEYLQLRARLDEVRTSGYGRAGAAPEILERELTLARFLKDELSADELQQLIQAETLTRVATFGDE